MNYVESSSTDSSTTQAYLLFSAENLHRNNNKKEKMSKHLKSRIVLNGKWGIEEKSIDLEEHRDDNHDTFLSGVSKW